MWSDDPNDFHVTLSVQGGEEDDAPECVQQDEAESGGGGYDKEVFCALPESHSAGSDRVGQDIDQSEGAAHEAKSQAAHISEHVPAVRHVRRCNFLQASLGFTQHPVQQVSKAFLKQYREH